MVLQGVAWMGMAVSYSIEEGSVSGGLSKTFDGEHPCPLCKIVKKANEEEGDPATSAEVGLGKTKMESFLDSRLTVFPPVPLRLARVVEGEVSVARLIAPEVPPPKGWV